MLNMFFPGSNIHSHAGSASLVLSQDPSGQGTGNWHFAQLPIELTSLGPCRRMLATTGIRQQKIGKLNEFHGIYGICEQNILVLRRFIKSQKSDTEQHPVRFRIASQKYADGGYYALNFPAAYSKSDMLAGQYFAGESDCEVHEISINSMILNNWSLL